MNKQEIEHEFQHYFAKFKSDDELKGLLNRITYQEIFSDEFLKANSKFSSMNDILWRSGFGIVNLGEVDQVDKKKWDEYIRKNTYCDTWYEFGKLAMIHWMKLVLELLSKAKKMGKKIDLSEIR